MSLNAREGAVERRPRLAIWVIRLVVAAAVANNGRVEARSTCSGQIAEGQSGQQQLQYKSARHEEGDQRPPEQTPRLMLL
jgi:hypothetical protein